MHRSFKYNYASVSLGRLQWERKPPKARKLPPAQWRGVRWCCHAWGVAAARVLAGPLHPVQCAGARGTLWQPRHAPLSGQQQQHTVSLLTTKQVTLTGHEEQYTMFRLLLTTKQVTLTGHEEHYTTSRLLLTTKQVTLTATTCPVFWTTAIHNVHVNKWTSHFDSHHMSCFLDYSDTQCPC